MPKSLELAVTILRNRDVEVDQVVRVDSAGDSGSGYTEILFVSDDQPKRAYLEFANRRTQLVAVVEDWGV